MRRCFGDRLMLCAIKGKKGINEYSQKCQRGKRKYLIRNKSHQLSLASLGFLLYTHQGLPTDRFHETVYNFSDQLGADLCATNSTWITIHAGFPDSTLLNHSRNCIGITQIILELRLAHANFLDHIFERLVKESCHLKELTLGILRDSISHVSLYRNDKLYKKI